MTGKISNEKACEMIKALFAEKLKAKEDEVELISQRIKEVQSALQLVRYGSVTNLSNQTQIYVSFWLLAACPFSQYYSSCCCSSHVFYPKPAILTIISSLFGISIAQHLHCLSSMI